MAAQTDTPHTDNILVINSGSSTIKYQLLNVDKENVLLKGCIEGIGSSQGKHDYFWIDQAGQKHENLLVLKNPDYAQSFSVIADVLAASKWVLGSNYSRTDKKHNILYIFVNLNSICCMPEWLEPSTSKCPVPIAIGHRVVHGGEDFIEPTLINVAVLTKIEQLSILAPLHNRANLQGIRVCLNLFPNVPQFAVFATAFHQTLPDYAFRYAMARLLITILL